MKIKLREKLSQKIPFIDSKALEMCTKAFLLILVLISFWIETIKSWTNREKLLNQYPLFYFNFRISIHFCGWNKKTSFPFHSRKMEYFSSLLFSLGKVFPTNFLCCGNWVKDWLETFKLFFLKFLEKSVENLTKIQGKIKKFLGSFVKDLEKN